MFQVFSAKCCHKSIVSMEECADPLLSFQPDNFWTFIQNFFFLEKEEKKEKKEKKSLPFTDFGITNAILHFLIHTKWNVFFKKKENYRTEEF